MGFIPKDAKWYLADLIEEITIEDNKFSLVHINSVLINANSPEEAFIKAKRFGKNYNSRYLNTNNKKVISRFRGLMDLNVIVDGLEGGAKIIYTRKERMTERKIKELISSKKKLGVFAPIVPHPNPNFMPKTVAEDLKRHFGQE